MVETYRCNVAWQQQSEYPPAQAISPVQVTLALSPAHHQCRVRYADVYRSCPASPIGVSRPRHRKAISNHSQRPRSYLQLMPGSASQPVCFWTPALPTCCSLLRTMAVSPASLNSSAYPPGAGSYIGSTSHVYPSSLHPVQSTRG